MTGNPWVDLILIIIILGVAFWVIIWLIDWVGLPEPFNKVAKVLIGLVAVIFIITRLFALIGTTPVP